MLNVPVTFFYDFTHVDAAGRRFIFHEFAANGAKHLVLTSTLFSNILTDRNLEDTLREEMSAEGLDFMDAHAMFGKYLDLNCPIEEARGEMLARHKLQLRIAAAMGVKTITIHVGNEHVYPEIPLEQQIDALKRSLDELLPLAEELGIVICIENIWLQINTPESLLEVKKAFPTDALGFCYDAGHANLMDKGRYNPESNPNGVWLGKTPTWDDRILEKMLPHVVNCHLHDNDGVTDMHTNIGRGNVDWEHVFNLLGQAPQLKVIQSEVSPVYAKVAIKEVCEKFFQWVNPEC